MGFGTLVVIVLAGLGGPLLGLLDRRFVPVVVGEILAGILVGPAVLGAVHPGEPDELAPRRNRLRDADADGRHAPAAARPAARIRARGGALLVASSGARGPGGLLAASITGTAMPGLHRAARLGLRSGAAAGVEESGWPALR